MIFNCYSTFGLRNDFLSFGELVNNLQLQGLMLVCFISLSLQHIFIHVARYADVKVP
jgi:hypothetical protein